jgi:proline dehydrogenase
MDLTRRSFIALSRSRPLRQLAEKNPLAQQFSKRFVAGTTRAEAIATAHALHEEGLFSTLDQLGESVEKLADAERAGAFYREMLGSLTKEGLNGNVSLKLTQMGMDLSREATERIVDSIVERAARSNGFVRIDMEDSSYTEDTIAMTERLAIKHGANTVGTVLQAYLYRTAKDVERLLAQNIRIRLCKGAYREGPDVAFPAKGDVDENYFTLACRLLQSGTYHGLATHDESLIERIVTYAEERAVDPSSFEFQMLFGVRRNLQRSLSDRGYRVRVYIPYGTEWYPYFMRRLAERPANVFFLAKNMFRA